MKSIQSLLKQFTQRDASPSIQFIKYAICGCAATGVHAVSFYLLAWLVFPALSPNDLMVKITYISATDISDAIRARNAMIDNGCAFILSNMTAYLLNVIWVFKPGRHHRIIEIGMFYLVSGISLALGSVLMGMLINYFAFTTTFAFIAVIIISVVVNFLARKYIIFKG